MRDPGDHCGTDQDCPWDCDDGYVGTGEPNYHCDKQGGCWSQIGEGLTCHVAFECPAALTEEHAHFVEPCTRSGYAGGPEVKCSAQCDTARYDPQKPPKAGKRIQVLPGWHPQGSESVLYICNSGTWTRQQGSLNCAANTVDCRNPIVPPLPALAEWDPVLSDDTCIHGSSKGKALPGTVCVARCKDPFIPASGLPYYICNGGNTDEDKWTDGGLQCSQGKRLPASECNDSAKPDLHAHASASCLSGRGNETVCRWTCDKGYVREGTDDQYTCVQIKDDPPQWVGGTEGRGWENAPAPCLGGCSSDETDEPVICTCIDAPAANAEVCRGAVNASCTGRCVDGYVDQGVSKRFWCGADGRWGGGALQCARPAPSPPGGDRSQVWWLWPGIGTAAIVAVLCCVGRRRKQQRRHAVPSVLRESFLGAELLPEAALSAANIDARWVEAAAERRKEQQAQATASGKLVVPTAAAAAGVTQDEAGSSASMATSFRRPKGRGNSEELLVMFRNAHVRELLGARGERGGERWRERTIGQGAFGTVHRARWRGVAVAVKVLKLPQRPDPAQATQRAQEALRQQVAQITRDFTAEVSACCDLNHPNLVRLLGYADQPRLMLVHEFMRGGSLDQQLYVERWQPSASEVVGVALDVARGMAYLHTFSLQPTNDHELPIIHRDLKSGNLLLSHSPTADDGEAAGEGGSRGRLVVKVADFGLSRDKQVEAERQQTLMMTGCGSMLWMAPEIVTGQIFNESVDVYSYAMCLVELLDCQLPWAGYGASIAHLAGRGDRPTRQLRPSWRERKGAGAGAEAGGAMALDERFASLVEECWCHDSSARPSFPAIVPRLEDMLTGGE